MTTFRFSAAVFAFLSLQGCESRAPNGWICEAPPGFLQNADNSSGQQKVVEQCIHKWSYRLGRAPGSNAEVADAAIGACRDALDKFLAFKVTEGNASKLPFTGELWNQFQTRFREQALFRVTQGRAGHCSDHAQGQ